MTSDRKRAPTPALATRPTPGVAITEDGVVRRAGCMNCGSPRLNEFIDLGDQPNGNSFPTAETIPTEETYPFAMLVCEECWLVQIRQFPSAELLFSDHPYVTGLNVPIVRHFEKLAAEQVEKLRLKPNSLVMDIGCNDGTLLSKFVDQGMRVIGVDPSLRTGELAREAGITVLRTFWGEESARSLQQLGLAPDLIMATAVFYHIPDLHDFVAGLARVMKEDSVFVTQCVSLSDVIAKNQYDHFYLEHSCIHSVAPLTRLFRDHGMRIIDVDFVDIHGGSFVAQIVLDSSPRKTNPSVAAALAAERDAGLFEIDTYRAFAERVRTNRDDLLALLRRLKAEGKRVFALGAPVKGSTLLNYCGITSDLVECASEVNPFKIDRFTPGTHIPIVDESRLQEQPDYYLVLSWNFLEYLTERYADFLENGGRFIVPVPEVRITGAKMKEYVLR